MRKNRNTKPRNTKPRNEMEVTLNTLNELLKSRKESERYFAKQKLRAYSSAEILKSGVRVKRRGQSTASLPTTGDTINVRYVGARPDGKMFDSGTFNFTLGAGEVIKAWDEAFKRIKEGQEATLFCPSVSAYGRSGAGKLIPPNTTLIFDVKLIKIFKKREQ